MGYNFKTKIRDYYVTGPHQIDFRMVASMTKPVLCVALNRFCSTNHRLCYLPELITFVLAIFAAYFYSFIFLSGQ